MNKPVIRTIHHLSCTGGTIISRCLAAMKNIALISEVHPYNIGRLQFNPFDPVQILLASNMVDFNRSLLDEIFLSRIQQADKICSAQKKQLIIRDHSHHDFLMHDDLPRQKPSVLSLLINEYETKSVVTVRDPKNAFISLEKNQWNSANLSFDQYCQRWLKFLETYKNIDIYRYEDFCEDPDTILKKMCNTLEIDYSPQYRKEFQTITLTGNSGRGKTTKDIEKLEDRPIDQIFLEEINNSRNYKTLRETLEY